MNLKDDRIVIKNIKDKNDENNKTLYLVANSGIQFIDFEFDQKINFDEDDPIAYPQIVVNGQFARHPRHGDHYARFREDKATNTYVIEDFAVAVEKGDKYGEENPVPLLDSLNLYNGIWFPIPYYCVGHDDGPTNWARARIINTEDVRRRENGGTYHVTLAFDTTIDNKNSAFHCAPTSSDINDAFSFRGGIEATRLLEDSADGNSYVRAWAQSVFEQIYPKSTNDENRMVVLKEWIEKRFYEKHYLNLIAFLEHFVQPNNVKLMPFDSQGSTSAVDVSLILDVGNSRSCGILFEDDDNNNDELSKIPRLELRDLNAVENVYVGTFDSKIEFQKANFDFNYSSDISSRLDAFVWPSLVRVGTEARILSAFAEGNNGNTGLISPKRYLWQLESDTLKKGEWKFNNNYYQIPVMERNKRTDAPESVFYRPEQGESRVATYLPISKYLNSTGDALFADTGDESKMQANYSGKSTMTFMLMEIIMQAMMQINSFHYRHSRSNANRPRRLKALVLTTPPSMPDLEREVFRSCAYQAIGLIWKAYGYDRSPADEFKFIENAEKMFPKVPQVILKWNETLSSQLVYLYNETQRTFGGNSLDFLRLIRRADADGRFNEYNKPTYEKREAEYVSARIASIDIGGGTTDLVIADYSAPDRLYNLDENDNRLSKDLGNQTGTIEIREVLKDGFKIAGDDLVENLITDYIVRQLGSASDLSKIVGASGSGDALLVKKKVETIDQIFTRIAYRIIDRLEALDSLKSPVKEVICEGSVDDFIYASDRCELLDTREDIIRREQIDRKKNPKVDADIVEFVEKKLGREYKFFERPLRFDILDINRKIARGFNFNLCQSLNYLNTIVNAYQCDILILTGRPSKIPGIRSLLQSRSFLAPRRIISLHDYRCGEWYPSFSLKNGRIGDPKTAVVVGALLGYIKQFNTSKLGNFRINPNYQAAASPARYMGILDRNCNLEDNEVKYRFYTKAEDWVDKNAGEDLEFNPAEIFTKADANKPLLKVVEDKVMGLPLKANLPVNLGYRQFPDQHFKASMLYKIEPYRNIADLRSVKLTKSWIVPDIDEISFDAAGREKLSKELFERLYPECTDEDKNFPQRAKDLFDDTVKKIKDKEAESALALEYAKLGYKADRSAIGVLAFESAFNAVVDDFDSKAMAAGEAESQNVKQTGFLARITNAASKAEELKRQGYENYKSAFIAEAVAQIDRIKEQELRLIKNHFIRELCKCVEAAIDQKRRRETRQLELVTQAVTGENTDKHSFDITIKCDDNPLHDSSAVGRCLKFMIEQEKDKAPDLFLLKIIKAEDKTPGAQVTDVTSYLNMKLRTVTGDEEYWNNNGLLLKE